jgi:hypothetical protein
MKGVLTLHKEVNRSKYNKFVPEKTPPDITKLYDIRKDGWRKKREENCQIQTER